MPEASEVKVHEFSGGIRVETGGWRVQHTAASGGAWTFAAPSASANPERNLLAGSLSSAIHAIGANSDAPVVEYRECLDTKAKLKSETVAGIPAVVAEGVFRNERGETLPVGFRRRTEYHPHGIVWTTIEFMSDCGCPGVVGLSAMQAELRAGMSDCHATLHPSQGGTPELLGANGKFSLSAHTAFLSRFTPMQLMCVDAAGEGIEFFPGSDLAAWDTAVKPDAGLGLFRVGRRGSGIRVELNPYDLIARRLHTTLQGKLSLRLGIALPRMNRTTVQAFVAETLDKGAVDAARRRGLKILARSPLREFDPSAPDFARNAPAWMHTAAPSLGAIYTLKDNTPAEALMCLNSGWAEQVERTIDHVLSDLPWDGVFFENAHPMPCCHPGHSGHGRGPFHSDLEGLLRTLSFCRQRTNVYVSKSQPRWLAVENFTDGA